jgi:hypothetical protein
MFSSVLFVALIHSFIYMKVQSRRPKNMLININKPLLGTPERIIENIFTGCNPAFVRGASIESRQMITLWHKHGN